MSSAEKIQKVIDYFVERFDSIDEELKEIRIEQGLLEDKLDGLLSDTGTIPDLITELKKVDERLERVLRFRPIDPNKNSDKD